MKKHILTSSMLIALATLTIFSCKKKDDTAPEDNSTPTTTTGSTTTTGGGTTTGGAVGATSNTLTMDTWEIVTSSSSTTYTVNQEGFTDSATDNTRSYQFGANIGTSSPVSLNFTFPGSGSAPASGTYTMIDYTSGALPVGNQVIVNNGGFGGGYSKLSLNSAILVTNNTGTITIEATGAKLMSFTGGTITLNAKVQH